MTYLALEAGLSDRWPLIEFRRLATIRRETNWESKEDLLALSAHAGVRRRPADGGNQLPSEETITKYWVANPGDLVFNPMWALEGGVAVSEIRGALSTAYRVYKLGPKLFPKFVHYFLRSTVAIDQYNLLVRGVTTFDRAVKREDFEPMPIPVPPLEAQLRIADFLDKELKWIDELVEGKRRQIKLLHERWTTLLVQEILGGVVPGTDLGEGMWLKSIDAGWEVAPLRRLVTGAVNGSWGEEAGALGKDVLCVRAADFDFPILQARNAVLRSYRTSDLVSRSIGPGELLLEKSGGGDETPVGRVVQWMGDSVAIPTNFAAKLNISDRATADYVLLLMRALYACGLNYRWIKQTTGIQNLDTGGLLSERVPVPSLDLQDSLVHFLQAELSKTRGAISKLESQVQLLQERRQALITSAVTGQLEI